MTPGNECSVLCRTPVGLGGVGLHALVGWDTPYRVPPLSPVSEVICPWALWHREILLTQEENQQTDQQGKQIKTYVFMEIKTSLSHFPWTPLTGFGPLGRLLHTRRV